MEILKLPLAKLLANLSTTKYSELKPYEAKILQTLCLMIIGFSQFVKTLVFLVLPYISLYKSELRFWDIIFATWSISELLFYLYNYYRFSKLSIRKNYSFTKEELDQNLDDVLTALQDSDFDFKTCFKNPPNRDISISDIAEWVIWLVFNKEVEELTQEESRQALKVLEKFENKFESLRGNNISSVEKIETIRPGIDAIDIFFKPLIFYIIIGLVKIPVHLFLLHRNFECKYLDGKYVYWIFNPINPNNQEPIVVMPGVGTGISSYVIKMIKIQQSHPNRKLVFIDFPHISLIPNAPILSRENVLNLVDMLFQKESLPSCSWVVHSFGSLFLGLLYKNRLEYITKSTMVDPFCFQNWNPITFKVILHSKNLSVNHTVFKYIFGKDISLALGIANRIVWQHYTLSPYELKRPTRIFFSTNEIFFDIKSIQNYLVPRLNSDCYFELLETSHGGYLLHPNYLKKVVDYL